MSLIWPLIVFLAQAPDAGALELGGTHRSELFDFEIGLPKGWTEVRTSGATLFSLKAPEGTLTDGAAAFLHHDSTHPVTLAFLNDAFRKGAPANYPGYAGITERDLSTAGFPASQMVFSAKTKAGKELVFVHNVIQRQLQEYFVLDVVAALKEKERAIDLADRLLASFRSGLPPSKEVDERIARTAALVKAAPVRPAFAGTTWHELSVSDTKIGWQKHVLREAKIDGAPGWEFEIERRQEDVEGGARSDLSKGSFTADGSIQRVEFHRTVRTPKAEPVDVRETVSLVKGACTASRQFLGQSVEKEFKTPGGTFLSDVAETMRRVIALAPAGDYAIRVLEPFRDLTSVEEWKSGGRARIKLDGKEEDLVQALVTSGGRESAEHLYDLDGALRRRKITKAQITIVLRRCTEQEAKKFK
ncbi:MAG TPA: hypothetical protein VFS19_05795 [Planctomycetota bacterium]|nr:hypothetical protein [Planctomycetota bacterium]